MIKTDYNTNDLLAAVLWNISLIELNLGRNARIIGLSELNDWDLGRPPNELASNPN